MRQLNYFWVLSEARQLQCNELDGWNALLLSSISQPPGHTIVSGTLNKYSGHSPFFSLKGHVQERIKKHFLVF
jgi:hypothetical protein